MDDKIPFADEILTDVTAKFAVTRAFTATTAREERKFDRTQPRTSHWASDVFKPCDRLQWFRFHGTPPTNPSLNTYAMDMGNVIEEEVVSGYRALDDAIGNRILVQQVSAVVVDPRLKLPIRGRIDAIVQGEDGWRIVEIKSVKDWGGDNRYCQTCKRVLPGDPNAWDKFLPRLDHVGQLTLYLAAYRDKWVEGHKFETSGTLHYRNRNTGTDKVFDVKYDERLYEQAIAYFQRLEELYKQPDAPQIPDGFKDSKFPCSWKVAGEDVRCEFWDRCWRDEQ